MHHFIFSPALYEKIEKSRRIISKAIAEHNPVVNLVGFSGGGDSMTVCKLMEYLGHDFTVFHCNTGIGIEETRKFVRQTCFENGWKLFEQTPTDKTYEELVLTFGFPGPAQHIQMYSYLKERAIRQILRFYHKKRDKMIITGVRTNESGRRKINATEYIDRRGRQLWVSPILDWDEDDKDEFLDIMEAKTNPVSKCLGMSGECLCGAFAKKGEFQRIKKYYPQAAKEIERIERLAFEKGFTWGWEDKQPNRREYMQIMEKVRPGYIDKHLANKAYKDFFKTKQFDLFGLCTGCEIKYRIDEQRIKNKSKGDSSKTT